MLIFLIWSIQRMTKTLASPALLGTSVQCMVLYWLLVEICWNLHWRKNCTTSIPFYMCVKMSCLCYLSCTHGRPCHISTYGFCLFRVCGPSPPPALRPLVNTRTHALLQFEDHSFCSHVFYGISNNLRVSYLYICVFCFVFMVQYL